MVWYVSFDNGVLSKINLGIFVLTNTQKHDVHATSDNERIVATEQMKNLTNVITTICNLEALCHSTKLLSETAKP